MAAKSKPRYLLMRAVSTDACDSALAGESPVDALSDMYLRGEMTTVRRSASPPEIEPGEVVFDRQEGLLYVHDGSTVDVGFPCTSCPDCDGDLVLQRPPERFETRKDWVYLCDRRDEGCRASCAAKADGSLQGVPANAETRRARQLTHGMFDRLWREAPSLTGFRGPPEELRQVTNEARTQAYRWFAHAMGLAGTDAHIANMDIVALRKAYRLCRDVSPEEVAAFVREPTDIPVAEPSP